MAESKQRTGKEIEGRRTAWRPGRAPGQGMCHRCAPTTRAENVLSGQERPSLTHTYIHAQVPPALIQSLNGRDHPSNFIVCRDCRCQLSGVSYALLGWTLADRQCLIQIRTPKLLVTLFITYFFKKTKTRAATSDRHVGVQSNVIFGPV